MLEIEAHAAPSGLGPAGPAVRPGRHRGACRARAPLAESIGTRTPTARATPRSSRRAPGRPTLEEPCSRIEWPDGGRPGAPQWWSAGAATGGRAGDPARRRRGCGPYAAEHPERQEVRIVAAVLRDGCEALRAAAARATTTTCLVLEGPDLVPTLLELLLDTLRLEPRHDERAGRRERRSSTTSRTRRQRRPTATSGPAVARSARWLSPLVVVILLLAAVARSPGSGPTGCGSTASATAASSPRSCGTGCCCSSSSGCCWRGRRRQHRALPTGPRPLFRPSSPEQANLDRYRDVVDPMRKWLRGRRRRAARHSSPAAPPPGSGGPSCCGATAGRSARRTPYFDKDIGFFVFDYPWLHFLVNFAFDRARPRPDRRGASCTTCTAASACRRGRQAHGAAQIQLSVLLGLFVLLKAVAYWLDRFGLAIASGSLSPA